MISTSSHKNVKVYDTDTCRFDITFSTGEYDLFESLLINKRGFNIGGLSFYCGKRPEKWKGKKTDLAITKGSNGITSIKHANIENNIAFGDINHSNDGCIMVFNEDFRAKDVGITDEDIVFEGFKKDISVILGRFRNSLMDITRRVAMF